MSFHEKAISTLLTFTLFLPLTVAAAQANGTISTIANEYPHAKILEPVKPDPATPGYDLGGTVVSDYVVENPPLWTGSL